MNIFRKLSLLAIPGIMASVSPTQADTFINIECAPYFAGERNDADYMFYNGYFYENNGGSLDPLSHPLANPELWTRLETIPSYCFSSPLASVSQDDLDFYRQTTLNCGARKTDWYSNYVLIDNEFSYVAGYAFHVSDWGQNEQTSCESDSPDPNLVITNCPTWEAGKAWFPGDLVRHNGQVWVVDQFHEELPAPSDNDFWSTVEEGSVVCQEGRQPALPEASSCPMFSEGMDIAEGDIVQFRGQRFKALRKQAPSPATAPQLWQLTQAKCDGSDSCGPTTDPDAATYPQWQASTVYVGGDIVSFNNLVWQANWWNTQSAPDFGNNAWSVISDVDIPWQTQQVYTKGDEVIHNGHSWQAQWWTQGEVPGTSNVWVDLGERDC